MSIPTPLEASGGAYTTHAEEIAFYDTLAADSPRFAYQSVGQSQSSQKRDMWLCRIGHPTAPATPTPAQSMLITACIHGNEFATREAAISLIRDLVYTTDPDLVAYLSTHPIYIMPTCNPDRIESQIRANGVGADVNRDHLSLAHGEARAIATAIHMVQPSLLFDMHEYAATRVQDVQPIPPSHPQIAAPTRELGQELFDKLGQAVTGQGKTFGLYSFASITLPTMLCNAASLIHGFPALTPETSTFEPFTDRYQLQRLVAQTAIEYHRANYDKIVNYIAQAKAQKIAEGRTAQKAFSLADSRVVLAPPPSAYRLTAAQHEAVALQRTLFRLTTVPDGDGYLVPMAQAAQPVIPLMFDPESPYVVQSGQRVYEPISPAAAKSWGPMKVEGVRCDVLSVGVYADGTLQRVWPNP